MLKKTTRVITARGTFQTAQTHRTMSDTTTATANRTNVEPINTVQKFKVTRKFTGGLLKGQTFTEISTVDFPVGFECNKPIGNGSPYIITECEPA